METLKTLLQQSAKRHTRLCPRQILGVRMGLYAGQILDIELPRSDKRLFVFMEIDGCASDGVAVATGCWVGRRTMRILDFGKVAATFVDRHTGLSIRIHPHPGARQAAARYALDAPDRWHTYLAAYQIMPYDELFIAQSVQLSVLLETIISRKGARARCARCCEEISNEREVKLEGTVLCRYCAGETYYIVASKLEVDHDPDAAHAFHFRFAYFVMHLENCGKLR